MTLASQVA